MSSRSGSSKRKLMSGDGSGFEEWGGYMAAKIQKLQQQFREDTPSTTSIEGPTGNIFSGISIFVNGYTKPSSAELRTLMKQHGGVYHQYYRRNIVTHIIASNLPDSKITNLTDKKVVRPEWITESINAGKLLPYEDYLLYTNRSKTQPGVKKFAVKMTKTEEHSSASIVSSMTGCDQEDNSEQVCEQASTASTLPPPTNQESTPINTKNTSGSDNDSNQEESCSTINSKSAPMQQSKSPQNSKIQQPIIADPGPRSIGDARNPNFLSEFYNNSRLHHISTWGAEYKAYVSKLHATGDTSFPGRDKLRDMVALSGSEGQTLLGRPKRAIMHIDMDCFFVSVGLRKRPDLIGKPVAVTHSKGKGTVREREGTDISYEASHWAKKGLKLKKGHGKGKVNPSKTDIEHDSDFMTDDLEDSDVEEDVAQGSKSKQKRRSTEVFNSMSEIASCNYEARQAGVKKNGMFLGPAKALCPDLETIPYDFDGYREVSQLLYDTVASFTHDIEAVSCDEMFVDCTDLAADTGATPLQFASLLRQLIKERTGCNASAGIGPNILLARMATHVAKPNGQHQLEREQVLTFLQDKSVRDLPGVGRAMTNKFATLNVTTCGELQSISLPNLQKEFGPKTGQSLHNYCRGIDDRQIKSEHDRKSVSAEVNYGIRFQSNGDVERFLTELAGEVSSRLQKLNVKGKTITLKLKVRAEGAPKETPKFLGHGICDSVTKSNTIPMATDNAAVITKEVMGILKPLRIAPSEHRGVGIQVSRLESPVDSRSSTSRGNQSILNFATKKQTPAASTSSLDKTSSLIKNADTGESLPLDDKSNNSDKSITENTTRIGQTAPVVEETDTLIEHHSSNEHTTSKITESTAGTSLEGIFRSKNPVILPRLPNLPSFLSPPSQAAEPKTPSTTPAGDEFILPSPSQVDPEVLQALPEDMRQQIEGAMAAKENVRRTRSSTRSESSSQRRNEQPASQSQVQVSTSSHDPIVALPSIAQLDPSCLDALPPDMREELLQAYQRKGQTQPNPDEQGLVDPSSGTKQNTLIHPLMQAQRNSPKQATGKLSPGKRSPRKNASPSRKTKTSPIFKKPRGQGPGRPRKQLNFGKTTPAKITDTTKRSEPQEQQPAEASTSASDSSSPSCQGEEDVTEQTVNLCGAVTLTEVKNLLREWTRSSNAPEEEDVNHLTRYLRELVVDLNLERLHQVILYLKRCLKNRPASSGWEKAFRIVENEAQATVQSTYGSRLNL